MVIVRIGAGLGNQLFQYAFARNLAIKLKTKLKIDLTQCEIDKTTPFAFFRLDAFNLKNKTIATKEELASIDDSWKIFNDQSQPEVQPGDNVYFAGGAFEQRENYFVENAPAILKEFTLKNPLHKIAAQWKKKIQAAKCSISLHIRNGDVIIPSNRNQGINNYPKDFYIDCLEALRKDVPNFTVFVFSYDMKWCKEYFKLDYPTEYVEGCEKDYEEMYLMSCCDHNIVAHSTFSFWGAYLNPNPRKKVFFRAGYLEGESCRSKNWIGIPLDYSKKPMMEFPPTVSYIFYIDKNDPSIEFALMSIVQQRSRVDYEIIVIDASNDNESFSRKFAGLNSVTIFNVQSYTDKYTAFNMGLNCARGLFVTFLTAKDFIVPDSFMMFCHVLELDFMNNYFNKYSEIREELRYHNYEKVMNQCSSNIVYSVKKINENENGTVDWANKKFEITCEENFKNLQKIEEMTLDDLQKINLIFSGNQSDNILFGKFFKRKFLNDYNIHFRQCESDEPPTTGGGVLFLIESMLLSKKITFVPDILFGRLK